MDTGKNRLRRADFEYKSLTTRWAEACGKSVAALSAARHTRRMNRAITRLRDERGDVPGWVLITLMTAGLVIIIWGLAGPALSAVFQQAIERVSGF